MTDSKNTETKKKYPALLGFAYRYQKDDDSWAFGIRYFRVALLLFFVIGFLWVSTCASIYFYMKHRRGFKDMTVKDAFIMPFDSTDIDKRHGDSFIERADQLREEGEYQRALSLYYSGTQKSPLNLDAKMSLAQLESQWFRRSDFALRTLELGVPFAMQNLDYMRFYLSLLLKENRDKRIIVLGNQILADDKATMDIKVFTAMTMATVYAMHGQYEKSSELISEYKIDSTLAGILRLSKNEWEVGNRDAAIALAKRAASFQNVDLDPVNTLLMNYYLEMGDYANARSCVVSLRLSRPLDVDLHFDYLKILKQQKNDILLDSEIEFVFNTVKSDTKALLGLANFAADSKNIKLMERIYAYAVAHNYDIALYALLRVETSLAIGDYAKAEAELHNIYKEDPLWLKYYRGYFDCLYCVAYAGVNNGAMASIKLNEILGNERIPARVLLATVRRLNDIEFRDLAHKLLVYLVEKNPNYQLAMARLVEMEMDMANFANLDKEIYALLQKRRPPRSLLAKIRYTLDSDRLIFTADRENLIKRLELFLNSKNANVSRDYDLFEREDDDRIVVTD